MKMFLVYDKSGDIKSVAIPSEEFAGQIELEPEPGEKVISVDSEAFQSETETQPIESQHEQLAKHIKKITEEFRIVNNKIVEKQKRKLDKK
jgi:hypothetical protein